MTSRRGSALSLLAYLPLPLPLPPELPALPSALLPGLITWCAIHHLLSCLLLLCSHTVIYQPMSAEAPGPLPGYILYYPSCDCLSLGLSQYLFPSLPIYILLFWYPAIP